MQNHIVKDISSDAAHVFIHVCGIISFKRSTQELMDRSTI